MIDATGFDVVARKLGQPVAVKVIGGKVARLFYRLSVTPADRMVRVCLADGVDGEDRAHALAVAGHLQQWGTLPARLTPIAGWGRYAWPDDGREYWATGFLGLHVDIDGTLQQLERSTVTIDGREGARA